MCRFRPHNGLTVEADYGEEALADGWRAIIAGAQFPPFDLAAKRADLAAPFFEVFALSFRVGHQTACGFHQRAVILKLLDVFENDNIDPAAAFLDALDPAGDDPGEVANVALDRLAALGLGKMFAVR